MRDAAYWFDPSKAADLVVNCTGMGASQMRGVQDPGMISVRGQTVLVRNDPECMLGVSGSDEGDEELTYIMKRPGGRSNLFVSVRNTTKLTSDQAEAPFLGGLT